MWRLRVVTALLLIKHSKREESIFIVLTVDKKWIRTKSTTQTSVAHRWAMPLDTGRPVRWSNHWAIVRSGHLVVQQQGV